MKRACVIGWPIKHSRSPLVHGYWLRRYGIEGSYDKRAVPPEELARFLARLAENGMAGCNVTLPHKERAYALAGHKDEAARAVEAANTLWLEADGLHASNTDTYGFMTHLALSAPHWNDASRPVLMLGAGGAARAVAHGLVAGGARELRIVNRTRARAEELAERYGAAAVVVVDWEERERALADCGLVVNTTQLGMTGSPPLELDLTRLANDAVVADIVYAPLETPLLAAARAKGCTAIDGLGMLLHQAVPGFEKWFGVRPEVTRELRDLVVADLVGG
jgi:shikimate dehydrogenase